MDKKYDRLPPMPPMPPFAPIPPMGGIPHPTPHRHGKPHNHSARFMPMLLHPHIPHHFNFWCNKIIPLAYDDSLSYYEVIAKTVDYLNNLLNDTKMLCVNEEELAQAFCELQNFVNDYFAFYQSKGIINYEIPVTNENYEKILPDLDTAQMNTVYRFKFVADSSANVPDNVPAAAKPFSGAECVLFNLSNFVLKRVGNEWVEISDDEKSYDTNGNYQLFITDRDIYFRENNGDQWGEWNSIFANWWNSTFEEVKAWVREYVAGVRAELVDMIEAETARATAAEEALDDKIDGEISRATAAEEALDDKIDDETARATAAEQAETARATAAENALSQRLVAEYERAAAAEEALDDKIDDETARAQTEEASIRSALSNEILRATAAEAANATAITNEVQRAQTAEGALDDKIEAETTRARAAETANANAISAEVSRASAAEQAETARATAAETANANAISAETSRASAAEQTLDNKIDGEIARATAAETANATAISGEITRAQSAEQGIRDGYIPNDGNVVIDDIILQRDTLSFRTNDGNSEIYADADGAYLRSDDSNTFVNVGQRATDDVTIGANAKAYYVKGGASATDNDEIATVGDVAGVSGDVTSLAARVTTNEGDITGLKQDVYDIEQDYLPNVGNSKNVAFGMSRNSAYIEKTGTNSRITVATDVTIESDNDLTLKTATSKGGKLTIDGDDVLEVISHAEMNVTSGDEIRVESGRDTNFVCGGDFYIQGSGNITLQSDSDMAIASQNSSITLSGIGVNVDVEEEFTIKRANSDVFVFDTDDMDITVEGAGLEIPVVYALDNTLTALSTALSKVSDYSGHFITHVDNYNFPVSTNSLLNVADSETLFKGCTFTMSNSAVFTLGAGKYTFENCVFVASAYNGEKVEIDQRNDRCVFKDCTFVNVDVDIANSGCHVVLENCTGTNDLTIATANNTSATDVPRVCVYGCRFDDVAITPNTTSVYDVIFANSYIATSLGGINEIMRKFNNSTTGGNVGLQLKTYTYTGTGTNDNVITLPDTPKFILSIQQLTWVDGVIRSMGCIPFQDIPMAGNNNQQIIGFRGYYGNPNQSHEYGGFFNASIKKPNNTTNAIEIYCRNTSTDVANAMNISNVEYVVTYLA